MLRRPQLIGRICLLVGAVAVLGFGALTARSAQLISQLQVTIADFRGVLDMDCTGRRALCEKLTGLVKGTGGGPQPPVLVAPTKNERFALQCEGYFTRVIVLRVTNWSSNFRALRSERLLSELTGRPYEPLLDRLDGLRIRYGVTEAVPAAELKTRLERLRAKTVGEFFYACGFEKIVVRGAAGTTYAEERLTGIGGDQNGS